MSKDVAVRSSNVARSSKMIAPLDVRREYLGSQVEGPDHSSYDRTSWTNTFKEGKGFRNAGRAERVAKGGRDQF